MTTNSLAASGRTSCWATAGLTTSLALINNDTLYGGPGNDTLDGGIAQHRGYGGPSNDMIQAVDGDPDMIECGSGQDTVEADAIDPVADDCEIITLGP